MLMSEERELQETGHQQAFERLKISREEDVCRKVFQAGGLAKSKARLPKVECFVAGTTSFGHGSNTQSVISCNTCDGADGFVQVCQSRTMETAVDQHTQLTDCTMHKEMR